MSARTYVFLTASAVFLSGCVSTVQTQSALGVVAGAEVAAGIPCRHVAAGRQSSVAGCETFVASAGPDMSSADMIDLNTLFRAQVDTDVNFDFDRDVLRADARAILDRQAEWIIRYPGLRFSVFGHTDQVGSADYNFDLAKRRADAVVAYLLSRGVAQTQLESVVSFGQTQPLIQTSRREERNRRTVTEVGGFLRFDNRTTTAIPCAWLDADYLPTYNHCIDLNSTVALAPVPSAPNPPRAPSVSTDYSSGTTSGTASITQNDDGSITRSAGGYTGPEDNKTTETAASATEGPDGETGNLSATVTTSSGREISASRTTEPDGQVTNQGGTQSVTN